MKTIINTLKTITAIILLSVVVVSCEKDNFNNFENKNFSQAVVQTNNNNALDIDKSNANLPSPCGEIKTVNFMAGQFTNIGTISIQNTEDKLYVTFNTLNNWKFGQIHLFVGSKNKIPLNKKGSPQIGLFPYTMNFANFSNNYTFEFNLSDLDNCFIIAAHAEVSLFDNNGQVIQSETAWGAGTRFVNSGSWATYYEYCKQECNNCRYETISYDMLGGQTILVGTLQVTNDQDNLYISYNTNNNWFINQVHLYVGDIQGLPINQSNTPIPGQFPYTQTFNTQTNSYTFTIPLNNLNRCYIIAAHASVSKIENGQIVQSETSWSFGTQFPNTNRWGWYSDYCTQVCN